MYKRQLPARHHRIHAFVDIVKLPPLRLVISVAQRLLEKLFGTDHAAGVMFQMCIRDRFYVKGIKKLDIELITGEVILISQPKRKECMERLTD